jgi:hypothetical protein
VLERSPDDWLTERPLAWPIDLFFDYRARS